MNRPVFWEIISSIFFSFLVVENLVRVGSLVVVLIAFRTIRYILFLSVLVKLKKIKELDFLDFSRSFFIDGAIEVVLIMLLYICDVTILNLSSGFYLHLAEVAGCFFSVCTGWIIVSYSVILSNEKRNFVMLAKIGWHVVFKALKKYSWDHIKLPHILYSTDMLIDFKRQKKRMKK